MVLGVTTLALAALLAVVAVGGSGGEKKAQPKPPPRIDYGADKLRPVPRPKKRKSGLPTLDEQYRAVTRLRKLGYPILCGGGRKGNYIALTFDDGPGEYTSLVLNILRKRGLRATFFLVGRMIENRPELPREEAKLGALGDHSWSHPYLPGLSDAQIEGELRGTRELIRSTSSEPVLLFRPPYGGRDARVDRIARSLGLLQILWSVDSGDSTGSDIEGVARNVSAGLKPGAIVLMHENRATTIKALIHHVLPEIKRRKFKTVTVPELLALDPPTPAQLRSRDC